MTWATATRRSDVGDGPALVESESNSLEACLGRGERTCKVLDRQIRQTTWIWNANPGTWVLTGVLKLVSGPTFFGRHIAELNGTNNRLVRTYVWGLDLSGTEQGAGGVGGLLMVTSFQLPASSPTYFAAYDGNGNVAALLHAPSSMPHAHYECGPFGEPIRVTGHAASLNPFRFSSKRTDPTTDLVLYEYRAYSPTLGRWLNRDPIGERGARSLYSFGQNNPVTFSDAFGLWYVGIGVGVGGTVQLPALPGWSPGVAVAYSTVVVGGRTATGGWFCAVCDSGAITLLPYGVGVNVSVGIGVVITTGPGGIETIEGPTVAIGVGFGIPSNPTFTSGFEITIDYAAATGQLTITIPRVSVGLVGYAAFRVTGTCTGCSKPGQPAVRLRKILSCLQRVQNAFGQALWKLNGATVLAGTAQTMTLDVGKASEDALPE